MNEQKIFDPFLVWKELYEKTESYLGKVLGESMSSEEFSKWMGNVLDFNLQLQKMIKETTERTLWQANMPSKEDLASIAALVVNVEEKLETMEEWLDAQHKSQDFSKFQRDIKRIEGKLDKLCQLLEKENRPEN